MPCVDAMITDVITARPEQMVSDALSLFQQHRVNAVPVIDDDRRVIGIFSFNHLLTNILPMSLVDDGDSTSRLARLVRMEVSLDSLSEAKPWVANRMILELPKSLGETMVTTPPTVRPDTPLREGIRLLVKHGSPLVVVSDDDNTLAGMITYRKTQVALNQLVDRTLRERSENNQPRG